MMRTAGIIAEYNPMHNGHIYHLQKTREMGMVDFVVCVMSGDFTQRGDIAILDKWKRAETAISCGCDLVLELPFVYATGSSEYFARGGVGILEGLGCVDVLSFGSESGNIDELSAVAAILKSEPPAFREALNSALKKGKSFPAAREEATLVALADASRGEEATLSLADTSREEETIPSLVDADSEKGAKNVRGDDSLCAGNICGEKKAISGTKNTDEKEPAKVMSGESVKKILRSPNNILALEYLKQIKTLEPITIKRIGGYGDMALPNEAKELNDDRFASAGAIRRAAAEGRIHECLEYMPPEPWEAFRDFAPDLTMMQEIKLRYYDMIRAAVLRAESEELADIFGIGEGLENKIKKEISRNQDIESFIASVKSKRYTYAAINRMLLHVLIGVKKSAVKSATAKFGEEDVCSNEHISSNGAKDVSSASRENGYSDKEDALYARVLAFNEKGAEILRRAKKTATIPIITNVNKCGPVPNLDIDIKAADFYNLITGRDMYENSDRVKKPSLL